MHNFPVSIFISAFTFSTLLGPGIFSAELVNITKLLLSSWLFLLGFNRIIELDENWDKSYASIWNSILHNRCILPVPRKWWEANWNQGNIHWGLIWFMEHGLDWKWSQWLTMWNVSRQCVKWFLIWGGISPEVINLCNSTGEDIDHHISYRTSLWESRQAHSFIIYVNKLAIHLFLDIICHHSNSLTAI